MVFQDISLYTAFVLESYLLAVVYVCVFRNEILCAACHVCFAKSSARGAMLFTQTPSLYIGSSSLNMFQR